MGRSAKKINEIPLTEHSACPCYGRVEDGRGSLGHSATLRFPSPLFAAVAALHWFISARVRLRKRSRAGPRLDESSGLKIDVVRGNIEAAQKKISVDVFLRTRKLLVRGDRSERAERLIARLGKA